MSKVHSKGQTVHYAEVLAVLRRQNVRIAGGLLELTETQYDRFRKMGLPST
jgi:hypothetical protein